MQTIQLNIQKPIRYNPGVEIKHSNFIQVDHDYIIYEGKDAKDISYLERYQIDNLSNMKHYALYSNYMILELFKDLKLIRRNMEFKSFKLAVLNEILKDPEDSRDSYRLVMNKMLSSFDHKLVYSGLSNTDLVVKSISSGIPFTATCRFSMNDTSEGFENTVLVYGIIRDSAGKIVGVNVHDYAGNANSNYQNRNGESVMYHGELYKKMFENSVIGIPVEESF